ncbi:MAG: DUF58 domain-containing protein [Lachnospiraceae bacterium]|nr:DUF58 domain-containing protein [Lachnospiraceae bacterium]
MNRNRIILCLLWVLALVGISLSGGPVTYGFFIMVTAVPLMSLGYLLAVRMRFSIYQQLVGKTFVSNQAIPYFFTLQDEDFFAFASVKVFFYSDFSTVLDLRDGEECELLPKTGVKKDTKLVCKYRGTYRVGIKTVEITDFLRIFRMHYQNPEPLEVTIYPHVFSVSDLKGLNLSRILNREQPIGTSVLDQFPREYVPGDDPRHIHWKATASTQKLMTRPMIGEERQNVSILLSTCRPSDDIASYLPVENRMLELALALSMFFLSQRIPVRAFHRTDRTVSSYINDHASFDAYYQKLCKLAFLKRQEDSLFFKDLPGKEGLLSGRAALLILNRFTGDSEEFVRLLTGSGVSVIIYLVTTGDEAPAAIPELPHAEIIRVSPDARIEEVL